MAFDRQEAPRTEPRIRVGIEVRDKAALAGIPGPDGTIANWLDIAYTRRPCALTTSAAGIGEVLSGSAQNAKRRDATPTPRDCKRSRIYNKE